MDLTAVNMSTFVLTLQEDGPWNTSLAMATDGLYIDNRRKGARALLAPACTPWAWVRARTLQQYTARV